MNIFAFSYQTKVQFSPQAAENLPKEIKMYINTNIFVIKIDYGSILKSVYEDSNFFNPTGILH